MKMSIALAAMCATALSPILSTVAFAFDVSLTATIEDPQPQGASAATKLLMQGACSQFAMANSGPNTWVGTLDESSIEGTVDPLSIVASGDRTKGPATGVGTPIPETVQVVGDPYRNGGSVNMFGLAEVIAAHYPDSEYDFTQTVTWNTDYAFTCDMIEKVPTPALGVHKWTGPSQAAGGKLQCEEGNANPHPFDDRGENCEFVETIPAGFDNQERDPEFGSVTQTGETDTLDGHESSGGPIPVDDEADLPDPVQVVVCISPSVSSKKTVAGWAKKNGYNGDKCTTTWYNTGALNGPSTNINTGSNNIVTIP